MNLQKILSQILTTPGPARMPLALPELQRIGRALLAWRRKLHLPELSDEQLRDLARRQQPAEGRLVTVCVDILRRRPDLAAELGVTADELDALARAASALEGVGDQVGKVLRSLQDALLLHTQDIARHNRAAEQAFAEVAGDGAAPVAERQVATLALGRLQALREARAARIARRGRAAAWRLAPLEKALAEASAESAKSSSALAVLRRSGREPAAE